jgi:hypothetical protein
MNTQLHYMVTPQRGVELRRAAERARLTSEVSDRRRNTRDPAPVTRLSMRPPRISPRDMTALDVEHARRGAR